MSFTEDMKKVYNKAFTKTIENVKKNPLVLFLPLIYGILLKIVVAMLPIRSMGLIGGFITALIYAAILSSYYTMLSDTIYYNRINLKFVKNTFTQYFTNIYTVYFVFMLINFVLGAINNSLNISLYINLVMFLVFNSIAENIYIKDGQYIAAFENTLEFIKENAIIWTLPLAVFVAIGYGLFGIRYLYSTIYTNVLEFSFGGIFFTTLGAGAAVHIVLLVVFQAITGFYIIFRGNLYKILANSTRRKREYSGELNDF